MSKKNLSADAQERVSKLYRTLMDADDKTVFYVDVLQDMVRLALNQCNYNHPDRFKEIFSNKWIYCWVLDEKKTGYALGMFSTNYKCKDYYTIDELRFDYDVLKLDVENVRPRIEVMFEMLYLAMKGELDDNIILPTPPEGVDDNFTDDCNRFLKDILSLCD